MTNQSASVETMYDPDRPWISGPDEDPNRANWAAEYFDPTGETAKPVFLRGQMLLAISRLVLLVVAFGILAGAPKVGAAVAVVGIGIPMLMSLVSHIRRLAHAGRPAFLALFIVLPFLLASGFTLVQIQAISQQPAVAELDAETLRAAVDAELNGSGTEEANEADAPEAEAPAPRPQMRRRGPPPTAEQMLAGAIQGGIFMWLFLSLFTMVYSLIYVARRPKGDAVEPVRRGYYD
ncbi:hypothetical protein [Ponticaulis sp.]|uniref:hypothetical protein n=1 Tax=Ponticaulis sp. TaxID=2020902 RepID=UPI0026291A58|nr:hypothetical protein [Ponticaulis sp.]MDF1682186.1 hypothetical protein [Ponticaulis sp.]